MQWTTPVRIRKVNNGVQKRYNFDNGYGASVVSHDYSYGGLSGKWDIAVTDHNGDIDYTTPITSDVIGHLNDDERDDILRQIANLPERK